MKTGIVWFKEEGQGMKKIPEREGSMGMASMIQIKQGQCGGYGDAGTHDGSTSLNPRGIRKP